MGIVNAENKRILKGHYWPR